MVNLTLSDHFNEYEVVRAGVKPQSSCGEPYEARDHYITRQFVSRLNATIETWRSLFRRLGIRIPPNFYHFDEIVDAVVQSCLRGELRFYKLPKIEKLKAIPCGKGMGICFVKGPKPHSRVNLNPLDISSAQEASDLVANIIASDDDLVRYLSSTDLVPNLSSVRNIKKIITDKLAAKEILAYKIPVYTNAPPKKQGELVPASGPGYDKVPLAPESKPTPPKVEVEPVVANLSLAQRKGVPPSSLNDSANRLNSMKDHIATNGHQTKYTDEELLQQAKNGDVANERYHVRFMEARYAKPTGLLGQELKGTTGEGAKYWSTTFDQLEDADSDSKLIAEKLGLDYDPAVIYTLIVIDTHVSAPLTGVASVPATFEKVSEFANRELPDEFPKGFTDKTMNEGFQNSYAEHHAAAVKGGFLKDEWDKSPERFSKYLDAKNTSGDEKDLMLQRIKMQSRIGNNQHYKGNGLTKNNISKSPNKHGVVETLNFERKKIDIAMLEKNNAILTVF